MPHEIAQDMLCLIEEHIPNPDRFAVCLCTTDGGMTYGVYIDDLMSNACAVVDDAVEAHDLVELMQTVNQIDAIG